MSLDPKLPTDELVPSPPLDGSEGASSSLTSLVTYLRRGYTSIKRPLAFLLILTVIIGSIVPIPAIQIAAIGLLGIIILETLFDIQSKFISKDRRVVFAEFFEASNFMKQVILSRVERNQCVQIRALGMSMGHAWPFLTNTLTPLLDREMRQTVELHIAMLDGNWEELSRINPDWSSRAKTNLSEILRFINSHEKRLAAKEWTVTVHQYRHMPNWHGILIDDDLLFLSVCFWRNNRLTGAENGYELLSASDESLGRHRIAQFKTWFEFVSRSSNHNNQEPLELST
jgi:hypothetical protein